MSSSHLSPAISEFKKRNLTTAEKTAKKNRYNGGGNTDSNGLTGSNQIAVGPSTGDAGREKEFKPKKKVYTPFPPPQQPSKVSSIRQCRQSIWNADVSLHSSTCNSHPESTS
jgi:hypothetical protein